MDETFDLTLLLRVTTPEVRVEDGVALEEDEEEEDGVEDEEGSVGTEEVGEEDEVDSVTEEVEVEEDEVEVLLERGESFFLLVLFFR